jgi:hypothetical protein
LQPNCSPCSGVARANNSMAEAPSPDGAPSEEQPYRPSGMVVPAVHLPLWPDTQTKPRRLFCPTCPAPLAKIFLFPKFGIRALSPAVPCSPEGASRSSRTSGAGCDGRGRAARRAVRSRTVKPCGPDLPTLGSSLSRCDFGLAAKTPRSARRRGLASPVPRGERGVSRKTIAQGVPE